MEVYSTAPELTLVYYLTPKAQHIEV